LVREIEFRHPGSEDAFDALLQTCTRLSIAERMRFIFLLLQQIFLPAGTACYLEWGEQDPPNIRSVYLNVSDISTDLAESWFEWAWALFNEGSSYKPGSGKPSGTLADPCCRAAFASGCPRDVKNREEEFRLSDLSIEAVPSWAPDRSFVP
jgi:hypothetical protein